MVCLLAAPWIQLSVSASNGWPHNALRHHWLMSAATSEIVKALLVTSLTHVSGAIASVQTLTFNITTHFSIYPSVCFYLSVSIYCGIVSYVYIIIGYQP